MRGWWWWRREGKERERTGPCRWEIVLLSTSAFLNTRSYLPSPPEERSFPFFPFSPLRRPALSLSSSHPHPQATASPPPSSFSTVPFIRHPPLPFIHSPPLYLCFFPAFPHLFFHPQIPTPSYFPLPAASPPHPPSPRLSMERPIQQQNKAAYSITRWLIKQDQNSAALRSTRQHYDTAPQCQGGGFSLMWRTDGREGWGRGRESEAAWRILTRTQDNKNLPRLCC